MKNLALVLILIFMSLIEIKAQDELTGLAGISAAYNLENELWGGGFEVAGFRKLGIGTQIEFIPADSLSITSIRGFLLWPITSEFLIKTAFGANMTNPKGRKYSESTPSVGFGFVYLRSDIYLGLQTNLSFEKEIAPTFVFTIGLKFEN